MFQHSLFQDQLQQYLHPLFHQVRCSRNDFPRQDYVVNVPFTIDYQNDQARCIQTCLVSGWTSHTPHQDNVPKLLAFHTAVTIQEDENTVIVFGCCTPAGTTSNAVFKIALSNNSTYCCVTKTCTGDIPPPVQGHCACCVGRKMYVFGGLPRLNDVYVLDLTTWD